MTDWTSLITAFTTLFVIIDAPGMVPLFIALTHDNSAAERRAIGVRACLVAAALMTAFLFLGEAVLGFIGISIPAFRVAGGVLLFLTALDMLFERRQKRRSDNTGEAAASDHDPSVFPLAMPLIVGPGLITTIILLASSADGPAGIVALGVVLALNLGIVFLAFLASPFIANALGKTGINVITRVLGMLLAALAVQFILDGLVSSGFGG
ncbi:MarC family protein [Wenxinia marina]|uniref:UPF0056 membrane protein n=1 Tax=Wenxinia marina DSM 24838 TaxID=1123501 RepID=A0A0D0Q9F7_9RHOB|nr:MarC family protein [Wenxinia marina]KIQ67673.1 Multiple antibiotic transporter [Wenxinia marina DSM 24838]GGL79844.1 UPF0056 inner membrane protein [Wenxinia marina]